MPPKTKLVPTSPVKPNLQAQVQAAVAWLEGRSTQRDRENLARFGIVTPRLLGVSMANLRVLAKSLGRDHELAAGLWATGWYEARLLAALVDEPARVTPTQMDRWCRDFDNWGICDTVCFDLFDRTTHAFSKVAVWSDRLEEFEKRAAFALLASLALHNKSADDDLFIPCLPLIEAAAADDRNFVKKGVSWALRAVGERNAALNAAAMEVAQRLAATPKGTPRWVGKDVLRGLSSPAVVRRLAARRSSGVGR